IVRAGDRDAARRRMLRALAEFEIGGVASLLGFHRALLEHPCFVAGETCHGVVESEELARLAQELSRPAAAAAAAVDGAVSPLATTAEVDGRRVEVRVLVPEPPYRELARRRRDRRAAGRGGAGSDAVLSPMQGTVLELKVGEGEHVDAGAVICIVEAMKMENEVTAHADGVVSELAVTAGQAVSAGDT